MKTTKGHYVEGANVFDRWHEDILSGKAPKLFAVGAGDLARIQVGPGLVTLFGGPPGVGKTAFTMQLATDALRLSPTLQVAVCNVEMAPGTLLDRQLARLSGIDLSTIRCRCLTASHASRLEVGFATLSEVAERLCFVRAPFTLENTAASCDQFFRGCDDRLIVLDYIQRIAPPGQTGKFGDRRSAVDACMDALRLFADSGTGVLVVSAVGRSKDKQGRNAYGSGLNLASFRESSELEFGADSAYILTGEPDSADVKLLHLKDRHGECSDIMLQFDRSRQHFRPAGGRQKSPNLLQDLRELWAKPEASAEEGSKP